MADSKHAKHRCKCFSDSDNTFMYGLRREGKSTERVLLERLLNGLSRAAAKSSKNPQRLWSEEPDWWRECTDLEWKNPREHPKDKKDTLKKKIDILEKQLRQRGLMTPAIEKELELRKNSKKADLELKSDFEAVIAKTSGLHYMMDQLFSKMEKAHVFSDKIAVYIRETKNCLELCLARVNKLFQRVESREERKQQLWKKHGVSPTETVTSVSDDVQVDYFDDIDQLPPFNFLQEERSETSSPLPLSLSPQPSAVPEFKIPPPLQSLKIYPAEVDNALQHSVSTTSPTPSLVLSDGSDMRLKTEPVVTLMPSILETIKTSDIEQGEYATLPARNNVKRLTYKRSASAGLPFLENGQELSYTFVPIDTLADENGGLGRRSASVSFNISAADSSVVYAGDGTELQYPLGDDLQTQKRHKIISRSKSWGGDMTPLSSFPPGLPGGFQPEATIRTAQPEGLVMHDSNDFLISSAAGYAGDADYQVLDFTVTDEEVSSSVQDAPAMFPDSSQDSEITFVENEEEMDIGNLEIIEVTPVPSANVLSLVNGHREEVILNDSSIPLESGQSQDVAEVDMHGINQLQTDLNTTLALAETHPDVTHTVIEGRPDDHQSSSFRSPQTSSGKTRSTRSAEIHMTGTRHGRRKSGSDSLSVAIGRYASTFF